ncbi:MAG: glycerol-3-phosphate dehydrogenase, partial [Blautia sp.]|nr:glycerol-3-phosphate dehydrogenase [Blautia sp.]
MAKVSIMGSGSWGMALSILLHNNGHQVTLWSALDWEVEMLKTTRESKDKLPGIILP